MPMRDTLHVLLLLIMWYHAVQLFFFFNKICQHCVSCDVQLAIVDLSFVKIFQRGSTDVVASPNTLLCNTLV